ncbi:MAG: DUF6948 domain-containing protein [bacterium]
MTYVIVRTRSAGCFAGELESKTSTEVVLLNARRLWYWAGAASLSQLAVQGTSNPERCKFPAPTPRHTLNEWIEIIETTQQGRLSIEGVPLWEA